MRFSPNTGSLQDNLNYWWKEADSCLKVIKLLLEEDDMAVRQTVCDKCHGMLERAAKAILSEKGILGDDKSHNIRQLLVRAGEFEKLSRSQQEFISDIANLHAEATYPDELEESRIWYTVKKYHSLVNYSLVIYMQLLNRKGSYGQGGSNESN